MEDQILKEVFSLKNNKKAKILARFFKTRKGQYGEGDLFLGIMVPQSREIALKYINITFTELNKLIKNKYHEVRLIAILILVQKYKKAKREQGSKTVEKIVNFYLNQTKFINNWNLVDLSAHYILGDFLTQKNKNYTRRILKQLANSKNLWERRIAIISTFAFIYKKESSLTFYITKMLLRDPHDLIHKACGWMLREVGKKISVDQLTSFLDIYTTKMPRVMLRYAIERLPKNKRKYYLHLKNI